MILFRTQIGFGTALLYYKLDLLAGKPHKKAPFEFSFLPWGLVFKTFPKNLFSCIQQFLLLLILLVFR